MKNLTIGGIFQNSFKLGLNQAAPLFLTILLLTLIISKLLTLWLGWRHTLLLILIFFSTINFSASLREQIPALDRYFEILIFTLFY